MAAGEEEEREATIEGGKNCVASKETNRERIFSLMSAFSHLDRERRNIRISEEQRNKKRDR